MHLAGDRGGLGDAAGPAADAEEVEDDDPRLQVEHNVQSVEVHVHEPVGAVVPEIHESLSYWMESILCRIILKIQGSVSLYCTGLSICSVKTSR